ncbi:DUF1488 family protein [Paraburkholderia oxyphila]|uniref:DUF1488 domain-containing protein n=1 Tax=Paraburkholderia oxyphila TaxID=614212 RepID=UPI00048380DC|nr:DUF1488 domain-containing protein [Paraburkholderia oxyphila]
MEILFPRMAPQYDSECYTLVFPADVDGKRIECGITAEALEDHFDASSICERDLVEAFCTHRTAIEETAATLIEATRGAPVLLHSGMFRLYGKGCALGRTRGRPAS